MKAPDLSDLISRVEAATGADREIDRDLVEHFHPEAARPEWRSGEGWFHPDYGKIAPANTYTASLDAALALVERVLPGWDFCVASTGKKFRAWVQQEGGDGFREAYAPTPALALLLALLKALQQREAV